MKRRSATPEAPAIPVAASFPTAHPAYQSIYRVVATIPRARVATYGQIAEIAGLSGRARQVGYALHALPHSTRVPWHRVVNSHGSVSPRSEPGYDDRQRELLEAEGVLFDARGRIDLERFRWRPLDAPGPQRTRALTRRRARSSG